MTSDTIPLLQAAGATVALVVGAVVRAWRQSRAEEAREAKRESLALARAAVPVLPVPDCARHSLGHSEAIAQTQRHIGRANETLESLSAAQTACASDLRLILDRLDRLERWLSPTSGESTNPGNPRKR